MTKTELIQALKKYPDNINISLCIKGKEYNISIKPIVDMESNQLHICFMNEVVEQEYWDGRMDKKIKESDRDVEEKGNRARKNDNTERNIHKA